MGHRIGQNQQPARRWARARQYCLGVPVVVDDLLFPALGRLANGTLDVLPTANHLTLNTANGLRRGFYTGYEIVDSRGRWFRIRSARKLHGVGPFGGYSLFLGQKIRVELDIEDEKRDATLEEVRGLILAEFVAGSSWESRGDFESLRSRLNSAETIAELLRRIA